MKKILLIALLIAQTALIFAQDYSFISKDLHKMTDEEMLKNNVQFSPNIAMFDVDGNSIGESQINDIMMSGNFMPVIFGNKNHEPKALVFRASTKEEKEQMKNAMSRRDPNDDFKTGVLANDFTTTDLDGEKVALKDLRGKVVVLNFWFTECQPCIAEMPELNKIVAKYKNKDVVFIAITFDDKDKVETLLKKHQFDYKIVSDLAIIQDYKVNAFPLSMVIDQKGEIIFKKIGPFLKEMDTKIGLALNQ